jgi:hypothetical protein
VPPIPTACGKPGKPIPTACGKPGKPIPTGGCGKATKKR